MFAGLDNIFMTAYSACTASIINSNKLIICRNDLPIPLWLLPWTLHKQRLMVVKLSINQHGIELRIYLRPFGILYAHYGIRVSCHLVSWNDISELGFSTIRHPRQQLSPFSWLCGRGWNAMAEVQLGVNQIMVQMHVINACIMDEHNFLFFHHRFIYCIVWEHIIMHDTLPSYMKMSVRA